MAVKMRLSRKGRKKAPFYHIVVADARSPRDGKFIEKLGSYNPMTKPATIELDRDLAFDWLMKGAQPTDTVKAILKYKGVYYKKHLMRGVKKGAMTVEQAEALWQKWNDAKESHIESRKLQTKAELETFRKGVSGEAKAKPIAVVEEAVVEATEATAVVEDKVEDVVTEVTDAVEEVTDAVVETPAADAPSVEE
jgi:small subunit ribosomal protein S16